MADSENSAPAKFDKDELKEWFMLSELAKLWSCSEDDLLQYGATGTLKICHLFKQAIADWKRKVCTDNGFTTNDLDQNVLIKEGIVGLGNPGNIYRIGRRDLLSLLRGETIKPWAIYPAIENTDGQLTFGIIKKRCQFGIVGGHLFPDATDEEPLVDTLKIQCLIVTQEEVNRFEQDHGISQPSTSETAPKDTSNPESEVDPKGWKAKARQIAKNLDPGHKEPKMRAFSMEIHNELKAQKVTNRNKVTPSVETIEREILRGWRVKS